MSSLTTAKEILAGYLPEEAERLIAATDSIVESVLVRASEVMDVATLDAFEALLETSPSPEKVALFCKERVPQFSDFVREELSRLNG